MANEEHLKILKQGVEQWNKWRLEKAIKPDLAVRPERCRPEQCQLDPCQAV